MESIVVIKAISTLLYPVGLAFSLIVFAWFFSMFFSRNNRRRLRLVGVLLSVIVLLMFSNPMVARFLVAQLENQYPQQSIDNIAEHDAVIVLGGGLRIPLPPAQHTQIGSGSDRYWYAVRLYRAGKAEKIILSGGNVYKQSGFQGEAYYAAQLLQEWGVPSKAILFEDSSRTTLQNKQYTVDLIKQHNINSALLVTSATHMPRAYELFNKLPILITPASADVLITEAEYPKVFNWIPSSSALTLSTIALHEYYGMWFADLKALISKG